jgi:hypothetical protein
VRGINIIVGCVAASVAGAPLCAYKFRPANSFAAVSFDDWMRYFWTTPEGIATFRTALAASAAFGLIVGMLTALLTEPINPKKEFELSPLRTPLFGAILFPGAATLVPLAMYNHSAQIFLQLDLPGWYFNYFFYWFIVTGLVGAACNAFLSDAEQSYEKAKFHERMQILCCWPFAICVGLVLILGGLGYGLMAGYAFGKIYNCPIFGAWEGVCIAVILLAFHEDLFWPLYFPMTRIAR